MNVPSQLQQLLDLEIPFAILLSNSYLGSDTFLIALASDCQRYGLAWDESFSQPLLKESTLTPTDGVLFTELRRAGLLRPLPLGRDGMAYELSRLPFRTYYQRAVDEQALRIAYEL